LCLMVLLLCLLLLSFCFDVLVRLSAPCGRGVFARGSGDVLCGVAWKVSVEHGVALQGSGLY